MRFLVDECTGPAVAHWLREHGHDVFSVYEEARGIDRFAEIDHDLKDISQVEMTRCSQPAPISMSVDDGSAFRISG